MEATMIEKISHAVPSPMLHINRQGRVLSANPAALTLLGDWIVGRSYGAVLRQPSLLDKITEVLDGTQSAETLVERSDQSGTVRYNVKITGLDQGVVLHYADITHLSEVSDMRRDFVANVSHELRTPLTSMLGFIETLRGTARNDPDAQERFLGIMEEEALRMNRLISDLLSLSHVEANERMRPNAPVDLNKVMHAAHAALRPRAQDSGHALRLEIAPDAQEAAIIQGDEDQVMQVILNLAENAMKYSGPGSPVVLSLARKQGRGVVQGNALVISVADQGPGIESVHLPRLTERFYRVDSHRSREKGGTGLGLAIVKHIANRHRARLKISSEQGKGSVFSVQFPAV